MDSIAEVNTTFWSALSIKLGGKCGASLAYGLSVMSEQLALPFSLAFAPIQLFSQLIVTQLVHHFRLRKKGLLVFSSYLYMCILITLILALFISIFMPASSTWCPA